MSKLSLAAAVLPVSLTLALTMLGCGVAEPAPFDPRSLGQTDRLAARDVPTYPMRPLPTTLQSDYLQDGSQKPAEPPSTGPSLGDEPQVRMTLQEVVQRAVANSNDIKVAAYQPAIDETRVTEAEARFDPTFFANAQVQRIDKELAFAVAGASAGSGQANTNGVVQKETDYIAQIGIRQQLESGGSIEFRNQSQVTSNPLLKNNTDTVNGTPNTNFGHDPSIENEFVVEITQPLLRDFGNDINRARIVINRNNQRISLLEFRKQIEDTISDIEKTYWQLCQAERNVRIQEELVSNTINTAQRLINRRGADVTRVQISQVNAQLESRRATLIRSKQDVKDLSTQLKRDMNDPSFAVAGPIIVMPAAPPLEDPIHFDPQDVIDTALANRFELGEQQLRVDSADTALKVGKNNLLPQLNAAGSISLQGLSGSVPGVLDDQLNHDYVNWSFGLQLEIPIGNRAARAVYGRALLQRSQAVDSYAAEIATVTFECKNATDDVSTSFAELGANRRALFAASDVLQSLEQREAAGEALTPEFVQLKLDQQERVAQQSRDEAASVSRYNQAIARLEQVKGTLLQYNNILMQEDMVPYDRKLMQR